MGSLNDRVLIRVRELAQTRGFRTALARRLRLSQPAITPYISGERPITLDMLEAAADIGRVRIAELVSEPGTVHQLNADEAALIRWLRQWPITVTRALCAFLAFFADEPSQVRQTRNLHEIYRRMGTKDRDRLSSIAQLMAEGMLTPDLLEGLQARLIADRSTDAAGRGSGRRRTSDDDA
jgi:transcriptional regulator with XRE-family HTH domain